MQIIEQLERSQPSAFRCPMRRDYHRNLAARERQLATLIQERTRTLAGRALRGSTLAVSEARISEAAWDTEPTATSKAAWFARDGLLKRLSFRTNCKNAARISSSVASGSQSVLVIVEVHPRFEVDSASLCRAHRFDL